MQQSDGSLKSMAAHYQNSFSLRKGPVFLSPNNFAEALIDSLSSPSPVKTDTNSIFRFVEKENVGLGAYGSKDSISKATYINFGVNTIYLVKCRLRVVECFSRVVVLYERP